MPQLQQALTVMHNAKNNRPMSNMTTGIILTFLTIFSLSSCGQNAIKIPSQFIETNPPKNGSNDYSLNHSPNEFGVKIKDGKLDIRKVNEINQTELKLPNGKLIGFNKGEWGGQLIFEPKDKGRRELEIKNGNIKFVFNFKNDIYFIEGLAHGSYSGGALFKLDTTHNKFIYSKILDFEDAPEAFTIYKEKLLIATHKNFYELNDFKLDLVFEDAFWNGLYPNSIAVVDDQNVFLGIRSGIVKLDLTSKTMKFYKYDK
jgi:hypothetical protein